jgi:multidrug efflux pump subunit AcrB
MKLSDLIEIQAEVNKALNAYQKYRGAVAESAEWDRVAKPLAKMVGKMDAIIYMYSNSVEVEVK